MGRQRSFQPDMIDSLLIRSANWIGDAVMSTPAVRAIGKTFANATISMLAKPLVAPVFENSPHVDRMVVYADNDRHHGFAGKLRLAGELRREQYDAALLLQNAFEAAFITAMARIPVRIGYTTDARRLLLTHPVKNPKLYKQGHHVDYYLGILQGMGMEADREPLFLDAGAENRGRAEQILADQGMADRPLLGLSPGATFGPAKQWHPERYAAVADRLCAEGDWGVMLLGGPGDRAISEVIAEKMSVTAVNLCGRTTVGEAMALVERCGLFVTNDSGLMHVAAAFDVPLVAVFGSTDPVATGPLGTRSRVVRVDVPCSPCLKPECPEGHFDCMNRITADMVVAAAGEVLAADMPLRNA
ncbi:MAG: lipopolysaccharide heptosyltransferase II [Thermodesulfobacteriota bacterium]|nr:lipopolysaccharide heptosyltransferase II [Thermodesulfobacteriota bacterium]